MNPVQIFPPSKVEPLLLDIRGLADTLAVSVRTVERMIASGEFPRPIRLNQRNNRWPRAAVEKWIAERMEAAAVDAGSPAALSLVASHGD